MECKYCGGIVRARNPGGMREWITQCDNCGRHNCEKDKLSTDQTNNSSDQSTPHH